ncbi:GAF domain-containing protein [Devosia aurantiaca]|uniref:Blue-light-activated histidine kinase n=1 Tax=Devosia aurantiaca TaxID=2714858 RepID=A0A6M1SN46_9HYPH|nr:GAF domain-containing protein [Devosia aurantiaca]NGP18540.1 GAF domain-containing protein [Devosia aurantiaca]
MHVKALRQSGLLNAAGNQQFDAQIKLLRKVLGVPVAVVSLLEEDKQVFAAHRGLPAAWAERGETPLTHSFCQYVVKEEEYLRVEDARQHPVLKDNLAIDDLGVVAYLGVPLRLPDGTTVGALAAIDSKPRDWTDEELDLLSSVAEVVVDKMATFISELSWRSMFEQLREGISVGRVVRDDQGRIIDWLYVEVNNAWGELVGIDPKAVVGRTVRDVIPGIEDAWVNEFAEVVETGNDIRFTRQVGPLNRWYDGYCQPTGPDTFIVLFMEVTDRVAAQAALNAVQSFTTRRQAALIEIGDRLRATTDPATIVRIAAEVLARALGASRVGYGVVDPIEDTIDIMADWCAPGVKSLAGLHRFRDYGSFIDDMKRGESVIITDVEADARTSAASRALLDMSVRTLVNVPLMEDGQLAGMMVVHYDQLKPFGRTEEDFVRAVADRTHAALDEAEFVAAQKLRDGEISHRLKNSMAMVQAIAHQTLKGDDIADRRSAFSSRLAALANAHEMLIHRTWDGAPLRDTIVSALEPHGDANRFTLDGPDVELTAKQALAVSLAVHELATNAIKYGALKASAAPCRSVGTSSRVTRASTSSNGPGESKAVLRSPSPQAKALDPSSSRGRCRPISRDR